MIYIYDHKEWPNFSWSEKKLTNSLARVRHHQGRLIGRMEGLGFSLRNEAVLQTLTQDVLKTSDIEGEKLDPDQVRSSIARRLGLDIGGLIPSDRNIDGVVEMMLDATQSYADPLTKERLFGWHAALFPTGYSGLHQIIAGDWRNGKSSPMLVVSGPFGREKVHFQTPPMARVPKEMHEFLTWFNKETDQDPVIKAGIAHLWFVTVHPFEDGNGRIARAIADMALARSEECAQRFYSMSAQIRQETNAYYDMLENTQKGELDITEWLEWFLKCLDRAFDRAENTLANVQRKARFWECHVRDGLNDRQRLIVNRLFDGFEGKLTSSKWAKIAKCSQDTASRDINDLLRKGVFIKDQGGGRSTSYSLKKI